MNKFRLMFFYYFQKSTDTASPVFEMAFTDEIAAAQSSGALEASFFETYFNQNMPLIVTVWLVGMVFFMLKMVGGLL